MNLNTSKSSISIKSTKEQSITPKQISTKNSSKSPNHNFRPNSKLKDALKKDVKMSKTIEYKEPIKERQQPFEVKGKLVNNSLEQFKSPTPEQ